MGFIDDLRKGLPGLTLNVPGPWEVHEEQPRRAVLRDPEHRVGWHLMHAPWRLDLREEHADVLRRDIERHARHVFEEQYAHLTPPPGAPARLPPRTADPDWSPVIDVQDVTVGGKRTLLILRRVVYEPGMEVVVGDLLIPLSTGLCDITAFQRAPETGYRESTLLTMAVQQNPGVDQRSLLKRLGQRYFDDSKHDAQFPNHPLTSVRGALRWLLSLGEADFAVKLPMAEQAPGEVELLAAGCAIVPPPRYLPMPPGQVPTPPGMSVLTRVLLDASDSPLMLDVWQVPDVTLTGEDRAQRLRELAERNAGEWAQQGAKDVDIQITPGGMGPGRPGLALHIKMHMDSGGAQSMVRWLLDQDGRVFRVAIGAPAYMTEEELRRDIDGVVGSFRRLQAQPLARGWLTSDLRLRPPRTPE